VHELVITETEKNESHLLT